MLSKSNKYFFYLLLVIISFISFEFLSAILFYIRKDKLFYSYDFKKEEITENFQISSTAFHPYFGYVLSPGRTGKYPGKGWESDWKTNNAGFHFINDPEILVDYPYKQKNNEIIVGIFGGSVGSGFALHAQMDDTLSKSIKKKYPEYRNKKIKFLNFSLPGYKQPQQLTSLIYFLGIDQKFDIIINIDGFNEVIVALENWNENSDIINPSYSIYNLAGNSLDKSNFFSNNYEYAQINYHKLSNKKFIKLAKKKKSAFIYYLYKIRAQYHQKKQIHLETINKNLVDQTNKNLKFPKSLANLKIDNKEELYNHLSKNWFETSHLMKIICESKNIKYHHFLQPNQWFEKSGDYSPIHKDHKYKHVIEPINKGYKEFLKYKNDFIKSKINFKDLTLVFDSKRLNEMYSDDCCHYTKEGYIMIFKSLFK